MVIQHNLSAMNSNRQLGITTAVQAKSSEKLSSGYKINRAADDAAGLAISEKMRRQIRGLTQASANAQDGISLVQVADGGMHEVHDMLQRGNELAVKAANDTLTDTDRSYIQAEIDKIKEEIDAVNGKTTFNEIYVLRGKEATETETGIEITGGLPAWVTIDPATAADKHFAGTYGTQVPYTSDSGSGIATIKHAASRVDFSSFTPSDIDSLVDQGFYCTCCTCDAHYSIKFSNGPTQDESSGRHQIFGVDISGAQTGEDIVDAIIQATGGRPGNHYTQMAKDPTNPGQLIVYDGRSSEANEHTGVTYDSSVWPRDLQSFNTKPHGENGQFAPGVATAVTEKSSDVKDLILQVGSENTVNDQIKIELPYISAETCSISSVSVMTSESARNAINSFKTGLEYVSQERSRMGAYQNRLEHTVKNLDNVVENTTAAESRIRDTDMAAEMVRYSNNNILAQAGQAMLAQANQSNQGVLSLLQ